LTVGVVGLGAIGMAVAKAFHARGCHMAITIRRRQIQTSEGAGSSSAFARATAGKSDVITLHVPLIPATKI